MSLRGRYWIDRLKSSFSKYVRFPVPPYHVPSYWDGVYQSVGQNDVFEWAHVSLRDLLSYQYTVLSPEQWRTQKRVVANALDRTASWGDTIGAAPRSSDTKDTTHNNNNDNNDDDEPIIILGCGNSKLGEDMLDTHWTGPILQVDVATSVLDAVAARCDHHVASNKMRFIQDDATDLAAFHDHQTTAVIDKGLVDGLFCTDQYQQCQHVLRAVHRVLVPGGVFVCFSLSQPCFLLPALSLPKRPLLSRHAKWHDIQIRQLDRIYLYRFQKTKSTRLNYEKMTKTTVAPKYRR